MNLKIITFNCIFFVSQKIVFFLWFCF
jgi:hypothetical protein